MPLGDVMESLKIERDKLMHECGQYKQQCDDFERKLHSQLIEISTLHKSIKDLEHRHVKLKLQYEEDLHRLQTISHPRSQTFGERMEQNKFPALTQQQGNQQDPNIFGFQSSLGKRKYEGSGLLDGQSLPRLEIPPSISNENGSNRIQIHNNQNTPRIQSPTVRPTTPVEPPSKFTFVQAQPQAKREAPVREKPAITKPAITKPSYRRDFNKSVQNNLQIHLAKELPHSSVVCCVQFSKDGKYLATGCNRKAQIFSVEDGTSVGVFNDTSGTGDLYLRSVSFSPDGKYLACGAEDKTAKLWDVEKKRCKFTFGNDGVGPKDGVTSVAISPDGRLIASGSLDRVIRLWDAHTGFFLERYEGHSDSVYSVAFSPDGKSLISGSLDKTLKLWDIYERRSTQCRSTFTGHSDFVLSVCFSSSGDWILSGSKDRTVQFWDTRSTVSHAILEGHKNSVISVAASPAGGSFATGSGDLQAKLWRYYPN